MPPATAPPHSSRSVADAPPPPGCDRAGSAAFRRLESNGYRASDGYLLQYRHWAADLPVPRAVVVALHGIQSHSGWYAYSSRRLAEAGFDVYFLDRRGSGLNSAARGHAIHEDRLIHDVTQFLTEIRARLAGLAEACPVVLMGVSWGGRLATAVTIRRPDLVDALALLYPGLVPRAQPTWWDALRLRWAQAIGWGGVKLPIPLNEPELFTSSPQWQEFMRRDELALRQVTIDFLLANLRLTRLIWDQSPQITCPVLEMLAGRDEIIDNVGTWECFDRMASTQRTFIEYPEARHTLEFEPNPNQFIDDLLAWLETVSHPVGA